MTFFDYFQIGTVAICVLIVVGKAAYLRFRTGVNLIAIGRGKRGLRRVIELISFGGFLVWIAEILSYAVHSSNRILPSQFHLHLSDYIASKCVGIALILPGLVIFALAFVAFGQSWRIGLDLRTPGTLVTTGIFAVSRNPIYVFLDLWFIGTFLINGTRFFFIFALLAICAMHWQILQEEQFLRELYGKPYAEYRARTARYLVW